MYDRTLDGQELTLAASGWTWNDTFVLWDHETGSLWFGGVGAEGWDDLVCIAGPLQDAHIERHEFRRALWRSWRTEHPDSKIMRRRDPYDCPAARDRAILRGPAPPLRGTPRIVSREMRS